MGSNAFAFIPHKCQNILYHHWSFLSHFLVLLIIDGALPFTLALYVSWESSPRFMTKKGKIAKLQIQNF